MTKEDFFKLSIHQKIFFRGQEVHVDVLMTKDRTINRISMVGFPVFNFDEIAGQLSFEKEKV